MVKYMLLMSTMYPHIHMYTKYRYFQYPHIFTVDRKALTQLIVQMYQSKEIHFPLFVAILECSYNV